jgi:hypothetical protein
MHRDRHRAAALPAASVLFGSFRISVVSAWRPGGKAALTGPPGRQVAERSVK